MLGLGNSISSMPYISSSAFSIADVSGIQTWLKFNEGQSDDGDRIIWADSSGQGNPIDDASAGTDDKVEFTSGSLHLKQLDSSNTHPEVNFTSEMVFSGAFTIFMVIDVADDLNTETVLQGSSSLGANFFRFANGNQDNKFRYKFNGNDYAPISSTTPSTSKALFRIQRNGSNAVDVFQNGTSLGGAFPAASQTGEFRIIRLGATAATAVGTKFSEVVIFNELVSDTNIALIEADINNRNSL